MSQHHGPSWGICRLPQRIKLWTGALLDRPMATSPLWFKICELPRVRTHPDFP